MPHQEDSMELTIAQAAGRCGLTAHTLRYYDREGLLPFVHRTPSGARSFKETDFQWLRMIICLKRTGMQVKQIRQYIDWCLEGEATKEKRLQMFCDHKKAVQAQMAELQACMEVIDHKIGYYENLMGKGEVDVLVKADG